MREQRRSKPEPKPRSKTVVVGQVGNCTIQSGRTQTVKLVLNAMGRKLLARFGRLPAKLKITAAGSDGKQTTVASMTTVTFKRPKPKKHR